MVVGRIIFIFSRQHQVRALITLYFYIFTKTKIIHYIYLALSSMLLSVPNIIILCKYHGKYITTTIKMLIVYLIFFFIA